MTRRNAIWLILATGWCLAASPSRAACTLNAVAVLPIRDAGAPMVFAAKINGNPADLAVGTGDDMTTIALGSAARLGLSFNRSDRRAYGIGGTKETYYGVADKVEIGGMAGTRMQLRGVDRPAVSRQALDGSLGMDVMASYDIDLDVAGDHVVLYEADGDCSKPNVAMQQPLYMVNLIDINHDRQADVDVVIEGRHFRAILETGLRHTSMFRSAARRLGLDSPVNDPNARMAKGFGPQEVAFVPHTFKSMAIGDLQFNNTTINVLEQDSTGIDRRRVGSLLAQDNLSGGHEMMIGADFMRKVHMWISHSSHKLIMQYPPQPSVLPH